MHSTIFLNLFRDINRLRVKQDALRCIRGLLPVMCCVCAVAYSPVAAQEADARQLEEEASEMDRSALYEGSSELWLRAAELRKKQGNWDAYFLDRAYYANGLAMRSLITEVSREMEDVAFELDSLKKANPDFVFDTVEVIVKRFHIITLLEQNDVAGAEEICNSLIEQFEAIPEKSDYDHQILISQYFRKAELLTRKGAYKHATEYNGKALDAIFKGGYESLYQRDGAILKAYLQNADCYMALQDSVLVRFEFERMKARLGALTSKVEERSFEVYKRIFDFYLASGKRDSASLYLDLLAAIPAFEAEAGYYRARFAKKFNAPSKAIPVMEGIRRQLIAMVGPAHQYVVSVSLDLAKSSLEAGDIPTCLDRLNTIRNGFRAESTPPASSQDWISGRDVRLSIEILLLEAKAMLSSFSKSGKPGELQDAWEKARLAVDGIDMLRNALFSESDRVFLVETSYALYELALEISYLKYAQPGDAHLSWADTAFDLMERSKSVSLVDAALRRNAFSYDFLPDSVRVLEAAKRGQILKLRQTIDDARNRGDQGSGDFFQVQGRLVDLTRDYQEFVGYVKKAYPVLEQILNSGSNSGLREIDSKLARDSMGLIEFFYGNQAVFFIASNGSMRSFQKVRDHALLESQCAVLNRHLRTFLNEPTHARIREFAHAASTVYRQTLGSIPFSMPFRVQVVPDGPLRGISFACLMTGKAGDRVPLYEYPFAVKKHQFSYLYSCTFQSKLMNGVHPSRSPEVDAFCPDFSPQLRTLFPDEIAIAPLPYNVEEVRAIAAHVPARRVIGAEADKEAFSRLALSGHTSSVLHLASHAVANQEDGGRSFIRFASDRPDLPGSKLLARELYGLELPYHLVFLSACETATGEIRRGEGFVGLARGFFYAGVESMITTLWTISDRASVDIVDRFYASLAKGCQKDKALWEAQVAYLNNQRMKKDKLHAHPFFWAAFIPLGDLEGMQVAHGGHQALICLGIGMLALIFLYLIIRKKFRRV